MPCHLFRTHGVTSTLERAQMQYQPLGLNKHHISKLSDNRQHERPTNSTREVTKHANGPNS